MRLIMPRNQRGDTIVEVLIAIAVIGSVLGTSYAIVNRNAKSYQQINERTEALKLAEGQMESLRTLSHLVSGDFCIRDGSVVTGAAMETGCVIDDRYNIKVTGAASGLYITTVEWDSINGGTDRVGLRYRI